MRKTTLQQMQQDSTLSEIQRMAAGCLIKTKKRNGHCNILTAAMALRQIYNDMGIDESTEYIDIVVETCTDREWIG